MSTRSSISFTRQESLFRESALTTQKHLTRFQVEKFTYLFNAFFDIEKNGLIEKNNILAFVEKLRVYCGWSKNSEMHLRAIDVMRAFHECIKDQVKAEYLAEDTTQEETEIGWDEAFANYLSKDCDAMNLKQWLNMWGRLCRGSSGVSDFPIWVQLLPGLFFDVIDRDGDGELSYEEIKNFYRFLVGIKEEGQLEKVANEGYRALTANGEFSLTKENYLFCFSNFLLGKSIYGPGKYIFGVFDNRELHETFVIEYNLDYEY